MAGRTDVPGMLDDAEREAGAVGLHDDSALARLREVKAHWDPQNVFRRNHNIAV